MSKVIDKLAVELSVEDIQPVLLKTLGMTKSTLIEWREIMASHGCQRRTVEIQGFIDMLVKAEKDNQ